MQPAPLRSERALGITAPAERPTNSEGLSDWKSRLLTFEQQQQHADPDLEPSLLVRMATSYSASARLNAVDGTQPWRTSCSVAEGGKWLLTRLLPDETLMKIPMLDHGLHTRIETTADPWPSLASARKRRRRC